MDFLNEVSYTLGWEDPNRRRRRIRLEEDVLRNALQEDLWSQYLMKPDLIDDFDTEDNRLMYNQNEKCYHLFEKPARNRELYDPGFKNSDFIFKTGPREVTLIEVKVCWENYLDEYPGWFTYNADNSDEDDDEIIVSSRNKKRIECD